MLLCRKVSSFRYCYKLMCRADGPSDWDIIDRIFAMTVICIQNLLAMSYPCLIKQYSATPVSVRIKKTVPMQSVSQVRF